MYNICGAKGTGNVLPSILYVQVDVLAYQIELISQNFTAILVGMPNMLPIRPQRDDPGVAV
jgi:hypothetical protein